MRHVEEATEEAVRKLMSPEQADARVLRQWGVVVARLGLALALMGLTKLAW